MSAILIKMLIYVTVSTEKCVKKELELTLMATAYKDPSAFAYTLRCTPDTLHVWRGEAALLFRCTSIPMRLRITGDFYKELPNDGWETGISATKNSLRSHCKRNANCMRSTRYCNLSNKEWMIRTHSGRGTAYCAEDHSVRIVAMESRLRRTHFKSRRRIGIRRLQRTSKKRNRSVLWKRKNSYKCDDLLNINNHCTSYHSKISQQANALTCTEPNQRFRRHFDVTRISSAFAEQCGPVVRTLLRARPPPPGNTLPDTSTSRTNLDEMRTENWKWGSTAALRRCKPGSTSLPSHFFKITPSLMRGMSCTTPPLDAHRHTQFARTHHK